MPNDSTESKETGAQINDSIKSTGDSKENLKTGEANATTFIDSEKTHNQEVEKNVNKKSSPFLSTEASQNDESDKNAPKKSSPFLTSDVEEKSDEGDEASTLMKQHDQIDTAMGNKAAFNKLGKLYFLSKKTGKLETRGEGKILIMPDSNGLYKVVMIRDKIMLKGCNHYIAASCPLIKATQVKNSWVWTAINDESDADKKEETTTYFATFKSEEDAKLYEEKYNYCLKENIKTLAALKDKDSKGIQE